MCTETPMENGLTAVRNRDFWLENLLSGVFTGIGVLLWILCMRGAVAPIAEPKISYENCASYAIFFVLAAALIQVPRLAWQKVWYPTSLGIFTFPFICFALGSVGFLFGISISCWHGILALLLTLVCMAQAAESRKSFVVASLLATVIWSVCGFFSILTWERREDGMLYHKPGSVLLAKGWNPVWQDDLAAQLQAKHVSTETMRFSHVAYFPKGLWVVNATLHKMFGFCEAAGAVYPAMIFGAFIFFYFLLRDWFLTQRWAAILAAGGLAFQPNILFEELFSSMIDGQLYLCLLIFLLTGILWLRSGQRRWLPFFIGSAVFGCSMKHNAPVFFGCMGATFTMVYAFNSTCLWCRKKLRIPTESRSGQDTERHVRFPFLIVCPLAVPFRQWLLAMFSIPALVAILCFNPYITNFIRHSSPFYPLHTFAPEVHPKEDILSMYYIRPDFQEASRMQRFLYTFLVNRLYFVTAQNADVPETLPQNVRFFQFYVSSNPFGPFPLLMIFSLPLLFFVRRWDFWLVILILILSTVIHPHSWWGRFVPQIWALPVLVFCFVLHEVSRGKTAEVYVHRCRWLFYTFIAWHCVINVLLFSFISYGQIANTCSYAAFAKMCRQCPETMVVGGLLLPQEDGSTQIASHPGFIYYFRDLFQSMGISNAHTGFFNGELSKDVNCFKMNRVLILWPKSCYAESETAPIEDKNYPLLDAMHEMISLRWRQFKNAWSEPGYPALIPERDARSEAEEILDFQEIPWIRDLNSRDDNSIPHDFQKIRVQEWKSFKSESQPESQFEADISTKDSEKVRL